MFWGFTAKRGQKGPKIRFSSLIKNDLQYFSDVLHKISVVQTDRIDLNHVFRKNLGFEVYGKNGHEMDPKFFPAFSNIKTWNSCAFCSKLQ